jgi:hypothetical protein
LIGSTSETYGTRTHSEAARTNAGLPENDFILGTELLWQWIRIDQCSASNGVFSEKSSAQGVGRPAKEVSP